MRRTIKFTRRHLPHWEVEHAEYFVTVRCADSLPREAVLRLVELHQALAHINPESADFAATQRQLFRTLEKFLDAGHGPVWQREWFDRWMRDEHEREKTINYIQQNPVKAGLAANWQSHSWTR
jgi:hypothetical protein